MNLMESFSYQVISNVNTPSEVYILDSRKLDSRKFGSSVTIKDFNVKAIIIDSSIKKFSLSNVSCEYIYCLSEYTTLIMDNSSEINVKHIVCTSIFGEKLSNMYTHIEGDGIFHYTKDRNDYFIDFNKGIMYRQRNSIFRQSYDCVFQEITTTEIEYIKSLLGYMI